MVAKLSPVKGCKGCGSVTRKLSPPGPRCVTCHRAKKKADSLKNHGRSVVLNYGITSEEYWALYEMQGGKCYLCGDWTNNRGLSKRLSVDHDHNCCPAPPTCGRCNRGLCCSRCNSLLGELGDSAGHLEARVLRILDYVKNPPAPWMLEQIRSNNEASSS